MVDKDPSVAPLGDKGETVLELKDMTPPEEKSNESSKNTHKSPVYEGHGSALDDH